MSNPASYEHVIVHIDDALAGDERVGELGLHARHRHEGGSDRIVVSGTVSTHERKDGIIAVVSEVLHQHGLDCPVIDESEVPHASRPDPARKEAM